MIDTLWTILSAILHASCQAAIVAFLIAGIQLTLGRRLSPNWRIALWSLVIIRLITPALHASQFSLLNLVHRTTPNLAPVSIDPQPTVTFGILTDTPTPIPHPSPNTPSPNHPIDWRPCIIGFWALGTLMVLLRLAISQTILLHRLRRTRPTEDPHILRLLNDCRRTLHAPPITCVEADWISSPALCGLFHHTLLLPTNPLSPSVSRLAATRRVSPQRSALSLPLSDTDLQFILMHELIHARRRDLLLDRLISIITAFHWFNPAAHLALRRIRTERELACDQAVLQSTSPASRLAYGQTLLTIAERLTTRPNPLTSIGVADRRCSMRRRLLAIASPPRHWKSQNLIAALCITLITFATFTSAEINPTTTVSTQPTSAPNGMVVRSYDVSPLLHYVPSDDPAFDSILKNAPHDSAHERITRPTTQQLAQNLISDIQSHIDLPSWKSASITESDDKLLVTQTSANQDAIWQYISSLMADHATQITVETRILNLSPTAVARWKSHHPSQPLIGDLFGTKADQDELMNLSQRDQLSSTVTAPRLTLFNDERGYCLVATSTAYVRDLHPSTNPTHPSPSGFEPDISTVMDGVRIDVRPMISADRKYITLEMNSQLSDLLSMKSAPWPKAPHGRTDLTIQIPTERYENLDVSVSLPNDGYFITPATETIDPAGAVIHDRHQVFFIIHATMHTNDPPHVLFDTTRPSPSPTTPASQP